MTDYPHWTANAVEWVAGATADMCDLVDSDSIST